jgi:ubiquinone/menaquinone biosynthesis C-methylase UbiE
VQSAAERLDALGEAGRGVPRENPRVTRTLDPEGAHLAALRRLADFGGRRVLEMGCGEGRLTVGIAADAAGVLAFDPAAESVAEARRSLPAELAERVSYRVASAEELEIEPASFDLVVFSWSL